MRSLTLACTLIALFTLSTRAQSPRPSASSDPDARLLLVRGTEVDAAATTASSNADVKGAISELLAQADQALQIPATSVMDKSITPPSGDKHDYMSQAPYWWPDPTKPDGKPYIRRDGERNPEINKLPDHDNLGRLCSTVATLGLAYRLQPNPKYAEHAARLTRVWFLDAATRMNPHLKFGQGIPGINEGRGIGIIETRGLPDLIDGVLLLSQSGAWTTTDAAALQAWMRDFLTWLTTSTHGQEESKNGNNHETWYAVQVASLALYTGQRDLARATIEGAKARIDRQFQADGRQPRELERTRSFDYSEFNLTAFFNLAVLGERVGVDLWRYQSSTGGSLRHGLDFLMPYAAGEKKWDFDQITPFRGSTISNILRRGAVAWKDARYRALADKLSGASARVRLLYP
jgi:Alginate lyase